MTTTRKKLVAINTELEEIEQRLRRIKNPTAAEMLHEETLAYQANHNEKSYEKAFAQVLKQHPDTAKEYRDQHAHEAQ